MIDLTGQGFGKLVVLSEAGRRPHPNHTRRSWNCQCVCGVITRVQQGHLISGRSTSCGCGSRVRVGAGVRKSRHGHTNTPTFKTWSSMLGRCYSEGHSSYPRYGGSGVSVCVRWLESYENFLSDMGHKPTGMTLDRVRSHGNYGPDNCRWASLSEQSVNKKSTRLVTFQGKTQCLKHWASELGMTYSALTARVVTLGWSMDKALSTPVACRTKRRPTHVTAA